MDTPRLRTPRECEYGELPELTRGLRALGSARAGGSAFQAEFFQPLLDARRRAADAGTPQARVRAFDPGALRRGLDRCIERIIAGWPDVRPAAQRALRTRLRERVRAYAAAVDELGPLGAAVLRADSDDARLQAWRTWTVCLAEVFVSADRCWISLRDAVTRISR